MNDDHLDAFVREAEESIVELNNSLLALEEDPTDAEAMDRIFRTAHTLKGNFGAMGFDDASGLAHAVEDLLDEIRDGELEANPAVMDLVFEGVDHIEAILDEIEAEGEPSTDPGDAIDDIRSVIEGGPPDAEADADPNAGANAGENAAAPGDEGSAPGGAAGESGRGTGDGGAGTDLGPVTERVLDEIGGGDRLADARTPVVHAHVEIEESEMKAVDGMLALESATEALSVVDTVPAPAAIEDGEFEDGFDLFVGGEDADAVEAALGDVGEISAAGATDVTAAVGGALQGDAAPDGTTQAASEDESPAADEASTDPDPDPDTDTGADADADADSPAGDESAATAGADGTEDGDGGDTGGATGSTGGSSVDEIKSVRVDVDQLDELYGLVEQLVTSRIKLRRAVEGGDGRGTADGSAAADALDDLDKITTGLQNTVMDMRLIPLSKVVNTFPRMVRDIARSQDKEIDFEMTGTDVELDRTILDEIADPLMHVLRNAADHGIEPPAEREAKGKPPEGEIRLRARRVRDHVEITVADDGAGLDVNSIREKAIEKGVHTEEELDAMDDTEVYELIFHPGFSTSDEVTDVSGRGVGMDVVHSTVNRLDGSVSVESEPGEGTTVTIRLPVTVAIVRVLFVDVAGQEYGIPIKNVDEITRENGQVETVNGDEVIGDDDDIYPVVRLREALDADGTDVPEEPPTDGMLVRIRETVREAVLRCDAVRRQEEVVVKPFEGELADVEGLGGTAVVGDGDVVPIIDVATL